MERSGEGMILQRRPHGENAVVVTLFTLEHGRLSGLVKGGGKKLAELQEGNVVEFNHRRRLESQLGSMTLHVSARPAAGAYHSLARLQALRYQCELLGLLLAEESPQPKLYDRTLEAMRQLAEPGLWQRLAFWELDVLSAVGFGLSLHPQDAVIDNQNSPLYYVSPKSGRAVSQAMGAPYRDRLLLLPQLFGGQEGGFLDVFRLTGHFLDHALAEQAPRRQLTTRQPLLELGSAGGFIE